MNLNSVLIHQPILIDPSTATAFSPGFLQNGPDSRSALRATEILLRHETDWRCSRLKLMWVCQCIKSTSMDNDIHLISYSIYLYILGPGSKMQDLRSWSVASRFCPHKGYPSRLRYQSMNCNGDRMNVDLRMFKCWRIIDLMSISSLRTRDILSFYDFHKSS